jgi:hypothetical protein
MTAILCSSQEWNEYDEPLFGDDVESNLENPYIAFDGSVPDTGDFLFDGSVPDTGDLLFDGPDLGTVKESYVEDFQTMDENLIADSADDCGSIFSRASRIRARANICPSQSQSPYLDVQTDEDVKRYWCSGSILDNFANIPVCKKHITGLNPSDRTMIPTIDGVSTPAPGFHYLPFCTPSRFIPSLHRSISSTSHRL